MVASYAYRIAALMEGRIGSPLAALEWYGKLVDSPEAVYALPPSIEILESLKQVKELKFALEKFAELVPDDEAWLKSLVLFKQARYPRWTGTRMGNSPALKKPWSLTRQTCSGLFRLEIIARANRDHQLWRRAWKKSAAVMADSPHGSEACELKSAYANRAGANLSGPAERCGQGRAGHQPGGKAGARARIAVLRLKQSLAFKRRDWKSMADAVDAEIKIAEDSKELQSLLIKKAEALLYGVRGFEEFRGRLSAGVGDSSQPVPAAAEPGANPGQPGRF